MKRETLSARLERVERRLRRVQLFSILAIALMASAIFAQRGESEGSDQGPKAEISVKRLKVGTILVQKELADDSLCGGSVDATTCLTPDNIWSSKITTKEAVTETSRVQNLVLQSFGGSKVGGLWTADQAGASKLIVGDPDSPPRFEARSTMDPILIINPFTGSMITVPAQVAH
jgi:hypothetical protein